MTKISKFFRLATEGATCDGRTISRQDIVDMAETYDRQTYGARVNMEHIRGFSADPPFCAYGDVVAVKTEEVQLNVGGKNEKRLALLGQVEALDPLVTLSAKGQKVYPSVEINPNFAGSGKAYLQGLAITDSPASLGTEILAFAAGLGDKSPFAAKKQDKGNFFSATTDGVMIELEEKPAPAQPESAGLFAAATEFFKQFSRSAEQPGAVPPVVPPAPANDNAALAQLSASIGDGFSKLSAAMAAMSTETKADLGKLRADHDALKASIENTDADKSKRPPATGAAGNGNYAVTDF
jgi:hypothetical protein